MIVIEINQHLWARVKSPVQAVQIHVAATYAGAIHLNAHVVSIGPGRRAGLRKGGTIDVLRENLNPRAATVVALPKPTEREAAERFNESCRLRSQVP